MDAGYWKRRHVGRYAFLALALLIFQAILVSPVYAYTPIKVGVHQNEPLVFIDSDGKAQGIYIDVLEEIAAKEEWSINYVFGSWSECLERLEKGEIDLLVDIAYSEERDERCDFTNVNVLTNWGQLYTQRGSDIQSILDLEGRRVAAISGDIYYIELSKLVNSFDVGCDFVEVEDYPTVFQLVEDGTVDAGVVNRLYGMQHEEEYAVAISPIVFAPVELRFAVPEGENQWLVNALDSQLTLMKEDRSSVYYRSLDKWLGGIGAVGWAFPDWLRWALVGLGGVAVFFVGGTVLLRAQVRAKTKELRRSEASLAEAQRIAHLGNWDWDIVNNELRWSDEIYRIFGLTPQQFAATYEAFVNSVHPDDREFVKESVNQALYAHEPYSIDHRIVLPDGSERVVHEQAEVRFDAAGRPIRMIGTVHDITEQKKTEAALRKLTRMLIVMSECNQAVVHTKEELDLLRKMCRIIVETGGYRLAWIGFVEEGKKTVRPVARYGREEGYLDTAEVAWADTELGQGPPGKAIQTGMHQIVNDALTDPEYAPWRDEAARRGYGSAIALPLTIEGRVFGVVNIYAAKPNAFDEDEVGLLRELASDIAYGIMALRTRVERERAEAALRESEERYRLMADTAPVLILGLDPKGQVVLFNKWAERLTGYKAEEVMGKNWFTTFLPERDRKTVYKFFLKHLDPASSMPSHHENYIVTKSGEERLISWRNGTAKDCEGKVRLVFAFGRDITERRSRELELQASEEKYHGLVEQANVAICTVDLKGQLTYVNNAFAKMLDYTTPELLSRNFTDFVHPDDQERMTRLFTHTLLVERETRAIKFRMVRKDGHVLHLVTRPTKIMKGGWTVGYQAILTDLTEREEAEAALRESEERLRTILESSPDAIVMSDLGGHIIECNQAALDMHGFRSKEEAIGKNGLEFVAPRDREKVVKGITNVLEQGIVKNMEYTLLTKDGREFPAEVSVSLTRDAQGNPTALVVIIKDITERKQAEAERLKVMGDVAQSIAHDIRNPLQAIRYAAYLLRDEVAAEKKQVILEKINQDIVYADRIVRNLMDFASVPPLTLAETSINDLLQETIFEATLPENVELTTNYGDVPKARLDRKQLMRVFTNLIMNAIQAMPHGGELSVSTRKVDKFIEVKIRDTGVGIPEKNRDMLFKPFFTTKAKGTGLGLPTSKTIIENHGGTIKVESVEGKGTTITVRLPIEPPGSS